MVFEIRCNFLLTAILRFKKKASDTTANTTKAVIKTTANSICARLTTMTYEAPMISALKFCAQDLVGKFSQLVRGGQHMR